MALRTPAYAPRPALASLISSARAAFADGEEDAMVTINGRYGERGVAFFTRDDADLPVGFVTLGKDHPLKDQTLNREQGADLVSFLIQAFGFNVSVETVTTIDVN